MEENKLALISEKDLSLVDKSLLNPKQLQFLLQRTPSAYVQERPAKGGGTWRYVSGGYVKKVLNLMFGFNWSFEIVDEMIQPKQVIVKGRLICNLDGQQIVKMQYGRQDVKFKRGTDEPLDLGNDLKGACTDALKKCASELGIAADIYNAREFKEVAIAEAQPDYDKLLED